MQTVPVMGAIMLSPGLDSCLLVRSWGPQGAWGFPRGKINPAETDIHCAAREVPRPSLPAPSPTCGRSWGEHVGCIVGAGSAWMVCLRASCWTAFCQQAHRQDKETATTAGYAAQPYSDRTHACGLAMPARLGSIHNMLYHW